MLRKISSPPPQCNEWVRAGKQWDEEVELRSCIRAADDGQKQDKVRCQHSILCCSQTVLFPSMIITTKIQQFMYIVHNIRKYKNET